MVKNIIIWIAGLLIALTSGLTAMGAIAKNKAPEIAVSLSPLNGFAAENVASNFVKSSIAKNAGQFPDHVGSRATEFARQAFLSEPVTPQAVAILALGKADQDKRKLMKEAMLLSRREPLITAWMIADSGAQQDMYALLNHYDTMLRTSSSVAPVILSKMADTLANEDFITPLANLLSKQPPWAYQFWGVVVATPEAVGNAARLRTMLYNENHNNDIYRDPNLIRALIRNGQFEAAEGLYQLITGQKESGSILNNGSFETDSKYFPIDWQLFSTGEYGAVITDGQLKLSAIQGSGGIFARQLVKLPAEIVSMDIISSDPISDDARITVGLRCAQAMEKAPRRIRISVEGEKTSVQIDNRTSGCQFYLLEITGLATEKGNGFDFALHSIQLR